MKKLSMILAALLLAASLTACGAGTGKSADMQVRESELTKEEQRILELFGISDIGHIFDYQINSQIKAMSINLYVLKEDLTWENYGGMSGEAANSQGRIAISLEENVRLALQDESGIQAVTIDLGDIDAWKESTAKAASWLTESTITDGEEIPLAVLIETSSNEIRTYGTEAYFEPERLGGHELVAAVTLTFTETPVQ